MSIPLPTLLLGANACASNIPPATTTFPSVSVISVQLGDITILDSTAATYTVTAKIGPNFFGFNVAACSTVTIVTFSTSGALGDLQSLQKGIIATGGVLSTAGSGPTTVPVETT